MDEVDAQRCWEAEVEKTFHKISGDDLKIQISELSKVLNFKRVKQISHRLKNFNYLFPMKILQN